MLTDFLRQYRGHTSSILQKRICVIECHKAGVIKEFQDNEQINLGEFNELLDTVAEDVYFGITPPVTDPKPANDWELYESYGRGGLAGRDRYDTPFYNGGGVEGVPPVYPAEQPVCFGDKCYGRSEVNYLAQGMWGAASGESWETTQGVVDYWNQKQYGHPASEGETFWAKYGHDYYKDWLKKKEEEWGVTDQP